MKYIIGAYVGSPALDRWDLQAESAYYEGLRPMTGIRGLEHPFYGRLHRDDDAWFLKNTNPAWDYVLTCIPGTMDRLVANPHHGLASTDRDGRQDAVAFHASAAQAVAQLNAHTGRKAVIAVQIHSAPRQRVRGDGSGSAFRDSLQELAGLNWHGASLVVEHCDAFSEAHTPDKGFLSLEEEIDAIHSLDAPVGVTVNWARSAIEGRSPHVPLAHVKLLRDEGLLRGLMFSGVSASEGAYGVWLDSHAPPAPARPTSVLPMESLLTTDEIRRCLSAAGPLPSSLLYLGAKVRLLPKSATLPQRLEVIRETMAILDAAGTGAG